MFKKMLCLAVMISLCSGSFAAVQKTKKSTKKPAPVITTTTTTTKSEVTTDQNPALDVDLNSDLREDVNKSIADLKGQIDAVKQDNSDAKVSGVLYFSYGAPQNGGKANLGFDESRAYLTFKEKLANDATVRITTDIARFAASTSTGVIGSAATATSGTALLDYLKYAYVEMPLGIPSQIQVIPFSLTARVGLQQTVWIDYDESIQGTRYMMKTLLDNEGIMTSADFGVGALGAFTLPYLPEVQYHATLTNGAGYKSAETNDAKDLGIRLNSNVYSDDNIGKLAVAAMLSMKNQLVQTTTNTRQAALEVSFTNSAYGNVYAEYVKGNLLNSSNVQVPMAGSSVGGCVYPIPSWLPGVALIGRADWYEPNVNGTGSDGINRSLYGVSYDYGKNIKFAVDVQTTQTGGGTVYQTLYVNDMVTF